MTALWSSGAAAAATGGQTGDWAANGVSIDTRTVQPGDLFIALQGERDGHDFVAEALDKGAVAAMVSRPVSGVPEHRLLLVDDVLEGLGALGRAGRARTEACVIAITGSVGKTSAKDMLALVLRGQGRTHAAVDSYNNHWGVPLTLARLPADSEYAVIEIGMNHPGEIAPLARMAAPHIAMITTIAAAHLAAFDDLDGIAREKASIFVGLQPDGIAVINRDVATAPILLAAAKAAGARCIGFGRTDAADVRLLTSAMAGGTTVVRAQAHGRPMLFKIHAPGAHFAMNALGVLATAEAAGADPDLATHDIAGWSPPKGRGTRETLYLDPVEQDLTVELIDDAFNANPTSMAAALEVLAASVPVGGVGRIALGRRIAILGDMLELGPDEAALHAAIADLDSFGSVSVVHCVGPRMKVLYDRLEEGQRGVYAPDPEKLIGRLHSLIDAGDVVLVKGSKGIRVSLVVDALRKLGHPDATAGSGDGPRR